MNRRTSSVPARRWTTPRRCAVAGGAVAIAVAGLFAAVAPASASPVAAKVGAALYPFISGNASVTAGGHKWSIVVDADVTPGQASAISIGIDTPHLGGLEEHVWGGSLATGVTLSPSLQLTINSGNQLAPIGSVSLTFKPTSHKTESANCLTGSEVVYSGTFSGSVTLNTGLKGLKIKGSNLKFAGSNTLTNQETCVLAPCAWSSWESSSGNGNPFANGMTFNYPGRKEVTDVSIDNTVALRKDLSLFRLDSYLVPNSPDPKFSKSAKSLSVSAGSAGLITGAATLTHGKPGPDLQSNQKTCKFNGKVYSVTGTRYSKATFSTSKPFEAHTILAGTVKVKSGTKTDFEINTLKLK
jgi:hypothetical protein